MLVALMTIVAAPSGVVKPGGLKLLEDVPPMVPPLTLCVCGSLWFIVPVVPEPLCVCPTLSVPVVPDPVCVWLLFWLA